MKKFVYVTLGLILVILLLFVVYKHFSLHIRHKVDLVKVIDGDTIVISDFLNVNYRIRFIGIDCFETSTINRTYKQAYENKLSIEDVMKIGNESTKILENQLNKASKNLYLEPKGLDKYGRTLGVIYIGETNMNDYMIQYGKCSVFNYDN